MPGTVKKLQFVEGVNVGAPDDLALSTSTGELSVYADDAGFVTDNGAAVDGSVYLNSTSKKFRYFLTDWRNAVPESDATDPTKTFLLDLVGCSTGVASKLDFNNTANRVYTFPNYDGTVSTLAGTETLTNKTITGGVFTGSVTLAADPTTGLEAATKQYVDNIAAGQKWKQPVRAATTANITLSGPQTIDGISVIAGDRVLVKNQTTAQDNGLYLVAAGSWARTSDADTYQELNSASVMVTEGAANGDKGFYQSAELSSLSTPQTWVQNFGSGLYAADESTLTLSGKTFSIKAGAIDLILPSQTGNADKFLKTDGTNSSWEEGGGAGGLEAISISSDATAISNYKYEILLTLVTPGTALTLTLPGGTDAAVVSFNDKTGECSPGASGKYIDIKPASGQSINGYAADDIERYDYANCSGTYYRVAGEATWYCDYQMSASVPEAGEDIPGTVDFYKTQSIAAAGDFTSGTIIVTRVGKMVTVSFNLLGHASSTTPSYTGAIPSWARPSDDRRNCYNSDANSVTCNVEVQADGDLVLRYFSASGTGVSRTSSLCGGSISYNV